MSTFDRMLCAVDFSPGSGEALRYAVALARAYDAQLLVCYCSRGVSDIGREAVQEDIKRLVEHSVAFSAGSGVIIAPNWESLVIEGDNPAEAIARQAAEQEVDLIVMSSRRRPIRAAFLGSTTERVCHTAPCSVFVVHPNDPEWVDASAGTLELQRLLVAFDFSDCAKLALQQALSLACRYKAEIHLLYVLAERERDSSPEIRWEAQEGLRLKIEGRLRQTVRSASGDLCKITYAVGEGKAFCEVLAYAKRKAIELIAIGARGTRPGTDTFFGSNVDRVLRRSTCPVLVARTAALQEISPLAKRSRRTTCTNSVWKGRTATAGRAVVGKRSTSPG